MKRLIIMLFMAASVNVMSAQDNAIDKALVRLEAFVKDINVTEDTPEAQIDSIAARYKVLAEDYKSLRKSATDEQAQDFARISTLYKKKISPYYIGKSSEAIDETSKKIGKWMKRQYKKAKGAVEGMTEK